MFYYLIAGPVTYNHYELISLQLDENLKGKEEIVIVSGAAQGVDAIAKRYAEEHNLRHIEFPLETTHYARLEEMCKFVSKQADKMAAIVWDGKDDDTFKAFALAEKYGIAFHMILVE